MVCYAESPLETVQQRLRVEQKNAKHMQNKGGFLTFSQSLTSVGQLHRGASRWPKTHAWILYHYLPLFSNDVTPSSLTEKTNKHLIRNESPSGQAKQQHSYFYFFFLKLNLSISSLNIPLNKWDEH